MSKGNPQIGTRITPEFMAWVEVQVNSLNNHQSKRNNEMWDVARFIRVAVVEKLKKMKRCREWRSKKKAALASERSGSRERQEGSVPNCTTAVYPDSPGVETVHTVEVPSNFFSQD